MRDPAATLKELFDAERTVRSAHDSLASTPPDVVVPHLERAVREALEDLPPELYADVCEKGIVL